MAADGHPLAPGTFVLVLALVTHVTLALYKLANRSTLRLPAWELFQIGLGLLIPFLLFPHIVNTRIAHVFFGVEDNYLYELARLWPENAILQSTLLLLVWVHGCLGLHFWLRLYTPYRAAAPILLFVAIAVPLAALGGFMVSGRAVALSIENPQMMAKVKELTNWPNATDGAILAWYRTCAARLCRRPAADRPDHGLALLRAEPAAEDRHQVYGRTARAGAARADPARDQPHAQHPARLGVRGPRPLLDLPGAHRRGRGLADPARLPGSHHARQHRRAAERATCLPGAAREPAHRHAPTTARPAPVPVSRRAELDSAGVEKPLAVMFLDLRDFTQLSQSRLAYDVVFILNEFFAAAGPPSTPTAAGSTSSWATACSPSSASTTAWKPAAATRCGPRGPSTSPSTTSMPSWAWRSAGRCASAWASMPARCCSAASATARRWT